MERRMIENNSQYRKGLIQAAKDNVYIVGKVYHKDGELFGYAVKGKQDYPYLVTCDAKGLHCNCQAGQRGTYCKHRAVCTQNMIEEAARKAAQDTLNAEQEVDRTAYEAENGRDVFDTEVAMTEQVTQFLDDHNRDNWLPVQGNQAMHLYR